MQRGRRAVDGVNIFQDKPSEHFLGEGSAGSHLPKGEHSQKSTNADNQEKKLTCYPLKQADSPPEHRRTQWYKSEQKKIHNTLAFFLGRRQYANEARKLRSKRLLPAHWRALEVTVSCSRDKFKYEPDLPTILELDAEASYEMIRAPEFLPSAISIPEVEDEEPKSKFVAEDEDVDEEILPCRFVPEGEETQSCVFVPQHYVERNHGKIPGRPTIISSSVTEKFVPEPPQNLPSVTPARKHKKISSYFWWLAGIERTVAGVFFFNFIVGVLLTFALLLFDNSGPGFSNEGSGNESRIAIEGQVNGNKLHKFDHSDLSWMLMSLSAGAIITASTMERIGILNTIRMATLLGACTISMNLVFESYMTEVTGSVSKTIMSLVAGFTIGAGIPASTVWLSKNVGVSLRGLLLPASVCAAALGMLLSSFKIIAICMTWIITVLVFLRKGHQKERTESGTTPYHTITTRVSDRFNCTTEEEVERSNMPCFWNTCNRVHVRIALVIVCLLSVLQQLSGNILALCVADDYFKAYGCIQNPQWYSGIMMVSCMLLNVAVIVFMHFNGSRRLLSLFGQAGFTCSLLVAGIISVYIKDESNEVQDCSPGVAMSVAGLMGMVAILVPTLSSAELLADDIRASGTGVVLATASLVLAVLLQAYQQFSIVGSSELLFVLAVLSFLTGACTYWVLSDTKNEAVTTQPA